MNIQCQMAKDASMQQLLQSRMNLIKSFRQLLVKFDFFPATQFFRYKGSTEYRTATGGTFTILIIAIFCILFFNALLDIIAKKNVSLKTDIQHQSNPTSTQINFGPQGGFLFALRINGMNLSRTDVKYFDIVAQQNEFSPLLQLVNSRSIPLEMCTASHFDFTSDTLSAYQQFDGSGLLCPSLNSSLKIQGKLTSSTFKRLTVSIKKCNTTLNSNCATDSDVESLQDTLGYFGFAVVLINTQLNPTLSTGYKQYYLEERNFFPFTTTMAVRGNADIQEYKITTDQSIIPLVENQVESGVMIPDLFQYNAIPVLANTYAVIHFQKSSMYSSYTRSFGKLDTLFAYVGGLIGTILGLIFILDSYNELCYELSLSSRIFTYEDGEEIKAEEFNFFLYLTYLLSKLFKRLVCCKGFRRMRIIAECQEQIEKQLDVALLLKKVMFFQRAIYRLSDQSGLSVKQFYQKNTIDQIKMFRLNYDLDGIDEAESNEAESRVKEVYLSESTKNYQNTDKPVFPIVIQPFQVNHRRGIELNQKLNPHLKIQLLERQNFKLPKQQTQTTYIQPINNKQITVNNTKNKEVLHNHLS